MVQKSFLLSPDNARYLARIKYLKGIKYVDLINMILDDYRKNGYLDVTER